MAEKSKKHKAKDKHDAPSADAKLASKVADKAKEDKPKDAKPTRPAVNRAAPRSEPAVPAAGMMSASHMGAIVAGVQVKP